MTDKFSTLNLGLAVGLHASGRMRFIGCEKADTPNRTVFIFEGSQREAEQAEFEFETGAMSAPVVRVLASQRLLRKRSTETLLR